MKPTLSQSNDAFSDVEEELRQWGFNKALKQTAINMIKKGYSDEQIAEITDIDVKQLQQLRSEVSH